MEDPSIRISYSLFCRLRPFWVLIPTINDRDTCQCKVHANAQYIADVLAKWHTLPHNNIEKLIEDTHCNSNDKSCMYGSCQHCKNIQFPSDAHDPQQQVIWQQWEDTLVEMEVGKGQTREVKQVKRTTKVDHHGTLNQLRKDFQQQREKLGRHIFNIRHQYKSLRSLRDNQLPDCAIIHMDFSENYVCKFHKEIQSVHFGGSHQQVSLHTGILYLPSGTSSFCTFSDNTRHDPSAIWAHLSPIIEFAKQSDPRINTFHFVSDGPTTQYRCRKKFYMFCNAVYDLGIEKATWNFPEAGHGKGPADGVGAVIKRTADALVTHGADLPNAQAVFDAIQSVQIDVKTYFISSNDINENDEKCPDEIPAIPGTMKLHQVLTESRGVISYRDVSCFCGGDTFCKCDDPAKVVLNKSVATVEEPGDQVRQPVAVESILVPVDELSKELIGRWCVVVYDGLPYPGIIQDVDDDEAEVKVMHRIGNNRFFWPSLFDDVIWYPPDKIVTLIPPVERVTDRHQQIRPDIWKAILTKLDLM